MATSPATPFRRRALSLGLKVILLALAAWLMVRLLAGLEWTDVAARVATAHPGWLAAAVAALVLRMAIWDERWRQAIRRSGVPPRRAVTFAALVAAAAVNSITPTVRVVGGVLRGRWIAGSSALSPGRAYGGVLFDQLAHQVVSGALTVIALIGALLTTGRAGAGLGLAGATLVAVAGVGLWARRRSGRRGELIRAFAERLVGRASAGGGMFERLVAHGREAIEVVTMLLGDVALRRRAAVLGIAFFLVNAGAQWLVFVALGRPVSAWVVLAVVSLGAAAGILVGTPGGLGAAEAAMIAGFTALGVDRLDATAASLLYRALHFAVVLGLGLPSLAWLEVGRRSPEPGPPTDAPSPGEGGR